LVLAENRGFGFGLKTVNSPTDNSQPLKRCWNVQKLYRSKYYIIYAL